jgi:hypothetical protein
MYATLVGIWCVIWIFGLIWICTKQLNKEIDEAHKKDIVTRCASSLDCSEYKVFEYAAADWDQNITDLKIKNDFDAYMRSLLENKHGIYPPYVRHYVRNKCLCEDKQR